MRIQKNFLLAATTTFALVMVLHVITLPTSAQDTDGLEEQIAAVRNIGPKGKGHKAASAAWKEIVKNDADSIPTVLAGMDEANVLAINWLRAAVDTMAENTLNAGKSIPAAKIESFLLDVDHHPRARRTAYEWLLKVDDSAYERLITKFVDDPSMELRRDAIAHLITNAQKSLDDGNKEQAVEKFKAALTSARDGKQIEDITKTLRENDVEVNLPRHFGFLMQWNVIGPFENTNTSGYDIAFPPENEVDLNGKYEGKSKLEAVWTPVSTDDDYGLVDLNNIYEGLKEEKNHKGAIAYAYTTFESDAEQEVDVRLCCPTGNKLWVNGKLIISHHVYHATTTTLDQFVGKAMLKKGTNHILIKIAQNEQEESWAQRWQFQLRICDQYGTAILATDRK